MVAARAVAEWVGGAWAAVALAKAEAVQAAEVLVMDAVEVVPVVAVAQEAAGWDVVVLVKEVQVAVGLVAVAGVVVVPVVVVQG